MKVKSTKSALLMSFTSLLLCFAMLIGSTFAWFTDSVTSGVNKIVAGNLDVELWHTSKSVSTAQEITNGSENLLFKDVALWEPGAYAYETFTVKNVGNLALKYKMSLNVIDYSSFNGHDLTEVLKVAVVDTPPTSRSYSGGVELKNWSYTGGATNTSLYPMGSTLGTPSETSFTVVVYWEPGENDNVYNMNNGRPQPLYVDLGINLVATQLTAESDSFDNQYDNDPDNTLPTVTAKENAMFAAMSKRLAEDGTEDLKVEKSGVFKEATVPAKVANAVFDKVFAETLETATDKSLTLVLNVEEKSKTETTFNYDIDMDAVIKEITGTEVTKNETKSIDDLGITFTDFVEVQMKIDSGFSNVTVKHNGNDMTKAASKATIPTENQDPDGYFNYDEATGNLTLWTKTFSPFTVSGVKPFLKVVHSDSSETTYLPNDNGKSFALKAMKETGYYGSSVQVGIADGDTVVLLDDCKVMASNNWAGVTFNKSKEYDLGLLSFTLDLNGHTLTANSSKYDSGVLNAGITISSGAGNANYTLNIEDRSSEKTGKIEVNGNGSLFKFESNNGNSVWTININGGTFIANNEAATLFAVKGISVSAPFKGIDQTTNKLYINVNGGTFNRDISTETKYYCSVTDPRNHVPVVVPEGYTFGSLDNGMFGLIANN